MKTVTNVFDLRSALAAWREKGQRIAFVPTMGALHDGHLALVDHARRSAGKVVVSIFVNPTQFGPGEDFERYPRDLEADAEKLREAGVDLLFAPPVDVIYPPGFATTVHVAGVSEGMEGARRPGHFDGVATVVARLLCLVLPDVAVFGQKDAQQCAVVMRLVADLGLPVEVRVAPDRPRERRPRDVVAQRLPHPGRADRPRPPSSGPSSSRSSSPSSGRRSPRRSSRRSASPSRPSPSSPSTPSTSSTPPRCGPSRRSTAPSSSPPP